MKRRNAIKNMGLATGGLLLSNSCASETTPTLKKETTDQLKGNINHSACWWCYSDMEFGQFIDHAKDVGLKSIELTTPEQWPDLVKNGLTCAVGTDKFASLTEGFNNPANHEKLLAPYLKLIEQAAESGIPNVICFSGNRNGISDEQGLENCAIGLEKIVKHVPYANHGR